MNARALVLLLCLGVAGTSDEARGQGAATPAVPPGIPTCGHVGPLVRSGTVAEELFWGAVPSDRLLIPLSYQRLDAAAPPDLEVVSGAAVKVVDSTGAPVAGTVSGADRMANAGSHVITWIPDEPMPPGEYRASVGRGDGQDTAECTTLYADFGFAFTVTDLSPEEWAGETELHVREPQLSCCVHVPTACCLSSSSGSSGSSYQCWDAYETPEVYVEWRSPGILYALLESAPQTDNVAGATSGARLGATLPMTSDGAVAEVFTLTDYGEFCVQGALYSSGQELLRETVCGVANAETMAFAEAPECRTRVPVSACAELPMGLPALGVIRAAEGATEVKARAALDATTVHTTAGCLSTDRSESQQPPALPDAGPPQASTEDTVETQDQDSELTTDPPAVTEPSQASGCAVRSREDRTSSLTLSAALAVVGGLRRRKRFAAR